MSPTPAIAFENGSPVLTVSPDFDSMDEGEEAPAPRIDAAAVLLAVLGLVLDGERDSAGAGRRVLLAAYLLRGQIPEAPQSLRELGGRLGCSKQAAGRAVTHFRSELGQMRGKQCPEG